jgi:hypothetical protein
MDSSFLPQKPLNLEVFAMTSPTAMRRVGGHCDARSELEKRDPFRQVLRVSPKLEMRLKF